MTHNIDFAQMKAPLIALALEAGKCVMEVYHSDFETYTKDDASPVTDADLRAEKIITPALMALTPTIPVIGEEAAAEGNAPELNGGSFWLVDPVDGTKEFLNKNGEFTVNIGLIIDRKAVLGVVYAPALNKLYFGGEGIGATLSTTSDTHEIINESPISTRPIPAEGVSLVASRRHGSLDALEAYLDGHKVASTLNAGSSLKFCLLAEGLADLYPRLAPTCEWDTAAGHAVLNAAGGSVTETDGSPFLYAKRADFLNPHFIAKGAR